MRVGLYFGTFNPIHVGHLIIANYMAEYTDLDEVWFVVSPHSPHKEKKSLLKDYHRLAMVDIAIEENTKLKSSNVEFKLPKPSYTATTLAYLKDKYPTKEFALMMGEDNLRSFHKWFNYETILDQHKIYVYPRVMTIQEEAKVESVSAKEEILSHENITFCEDVPVMKIS